MKAHVIWFDKIDMNGLLECEDGNRRYFDSKNVFKKQQQVNFNKNLEFKPDLFAINVKPICENHFYEHGHCLDCGEWSGK